MPDINIVALIVATLGAGGIGAAIREIVSVITLARQGVSGKEDRRRIDINAQRDDAIKRMEAAEEDEKEERERADRAERARDEEREKRRIYYEEAARLRYIIVLNGLNPGAWPDINEDTAR